MREPADTTDIRVDSIKEIDFSGLRMPVVVIYKSPVDYPGQAVARVFDLNEPTRVILTANSPEELRQDIETYTDFIFIPRAAEDDDVIIGTYL